MTRVFPLPSATHFWGWRGIAWDVMKRPTFNTVAMRTVTGRRAATAAYPTPLTKYTLKWNFLRDNFAVARNAARTFPATEAETLMAFFVEMQGAATPFFWSDPTDNRVTAQVIAASTPEVGEDLANPDSRNYQLVRSLGGITSPVGGLDSAMSLPVINDDGTPVTFVANSPRDGWIRLDAAPAEGSVLTGTFHYYQRVVFAEDTADFRTFAANFWELRQLELETARF